jgi:DNA mismatch repair protein MutL
MGHIRLMDPHLTNMIAAGEVVERPANIVKELVENSVDASSRHITIELIESGLKLIRVIDDGSGLDQEDLALAFERHATSKIQNEYDLFHIQTLGFRGEALPSIASVSQVEMKSSTDGINGKVIVIHQGKCLLQASVAQQIGTMVSVSKLFYNTPARLKYLKSPQYELAIITDLIDKMSLANPHIAFKLSNNEKILLQTNGNGNQLEVLAEVYGFETAKNMHPFHNKNRDYTISGYFATPTFAKTSKQAICLVVNGRHVRHYKIAQTIVEAYGQTIPKEKTPIVFLRIQGDPSLLDVNIHPTKQEVKFSEEDRLLELIRQSIQEQLQSLFLIPSISSDSNHVLQLQETMDLRSSTIIEESTPLESTPHSIPSSIVSEQLPLTKFPYMEYVGQYAGTYLLFQNAEGLYLLDQHAAAERIRYERYLAKMSSQNLDTYDLLIPLEFELSTQEGITLLQHISSLEAFGIHIEQIDSRRYQVSRIPSWFPPQYELAYVMEYVNLILHHQVIDLSKVVDQLAILLSCKHSLKANHYVSREEAYALMKEIDQTQHPYTCPHGRPVLIKIDDYQIQKWFSRVTS